MEDGIDRYLTREPIGIISIGKKVVPRINSIRPFIRRMEFFIFIGNLRRKINGNEGAYDANEIRSEID